MKVYKLTETERQVLASFGGTSVIACGPWSREPGNLANRVVLRDHGDEFIVHRQVLADVSESTLGGISYCWGHYFPKRDDEAFEKAWVRFEQKVREHQGLPSRQD